MTSELNRKLPINRDLYGSLQTILRNHLGRKRIKYAVVVSIQATTRQREASPPVCRPRTFSFINIKSFKSPGDSYPRSRKRSYPARVLSSEGALLEAILKWDRARAGRCGVSRACRRGARGCVSQTQTRGALGNRPCPLRGAAFSGWTGLEREGESPRDHGESLSSSRKNGPKDEEVAAGGAPGGVAACLCFPRETCRGVLQCAVRRSASPSPRGEAK